MLERHLSFQELGSLSNHLMSCACCNSSSALANVISLLPDRVKNAIVYSPQTTLAQQITTLVQTCLDYQELTSLLEVVYYYEGNGSTIAWKAVENFLILNKIDTQNQQIIFNSSRTKQISESTLQNNGSEYTTRAGVQSPALVIILVDVGYHMTKMVQNKAAIEIIEETLSRTLIQVIRRSTKGANIAPRYHMGYYFYTNEVHDMLNGIKTVEEVAHEGIPSLTIRNERGDTYNAFLQIKQLLQTHLEVYQNSPPPLICHISGGEYPGRNPEPITEEIKSMKVGDGYVLIENILIDDEAILLKTYNPKFWPGIRDESDLAKAHARQLYRMSSVIPDTYLRVATDLGFYLAKGSRMLYPGTHPDIIGLGIVMSIATAV